MSTARYYDMSFENLHIDMRELYLLMGYGDQTPNQSILEIIDDIVLELAPICKPYFGYILASGERVEKDQIKINNTTLTPGAIITSALRDSTQYAIFTATIGTDFDEWLEQVKKDDDIVKLFVGNTLGSILAESVVTELTKQLAKDMAEIGLSISNNYSPGYCDWKLTEQKLLFSLLPEGISKIELTDSCLMLPVKSVSGIIGVGENIKKRAYRCEICTMTNCVKNQKQPKM